jgi:hypothetical protein
MACLKNNRLLQYVGGLQGGFNSLHQFRGTITKLVKVRESIRWVHESSTPKPSTFRNDTDSLFLTKQSKLRNDAVSKLLFDLERVLIDHKFEGNEKTQLAIEEFCFDQFTTLGDKSKYKADEDRILTAGLNKFLMGKLDILKGYFESFIVNTTDLLEYKASKSVTNVDAALLDIEEVDFNTLDKGEVKVQKKLHNKLKRESLVKIISTLGITEVCGAAIYIFYTCLTY